MRTRKEELNVEVVPDSTPLTVIPDIETDYWIQEVDDEESDEGWDNGHR